MPAERLSMREVREVLRLRHACGASVRLIARSVGVGHTTVGEYLRRTAVIGITWPVPAELDDAELERRLFTPAGFYKMPTRVMPDWHHVHAELRRRSVTLLLLWEEYRAEHPDGYGYSRVCDLYTPPGAGHGVEGARGRGAGGPGRQRSDAGAGQPPRPLPGLRGRPVVAVVGPIGRSRIDRTCGRGGPERPSGKWIVTCPRKGSDRAGVNGVTSRTPSEINVSSTALRT